MREINLTRIQEEKLKGAMHAENFNRSQLQMMQHQHSTSAQYRQDILELIYGSNGIDPKDIPAGSKITVKDSVLCIQEPEQKTIPMPSIDPGFKKTKSK